MSDHSEPVLVPLNVRLEEQSHGRVTEHPPSNNVPCHTCYKLKILILLLSECADKTSDSVNIMLRLLRH